MKKSTLITTIAMIVVVVVALSTATYAWFTSGSTTNAVASMSTTAAADFSLTVVTDVAATGKNWSMGQTGTGLSLSGSTGLTAPTDTIATAIPYTASAIEVSSVASFYEATYASTTTAKVKTAAAPRGIDALRVTNIKSTDKHLYLYVIIAVDAENANANSLYAAQATSFYVTSAKTSANVQSSVENSEPAPSTAVASSWTNGYGKATVTTAAADATLEKGTPVGAGSFKNEYIVAETTKALVARPAYNGLTAGFIRANEQVALGVADGQYVLAYIIDLGTLVPNESLVLGVYTWIDGWAADNAAGGAAYNVNYAFTSDLQYLTVKAS